MGTIVDTSKVFGIMSDVDHSGEMSDKNYEKNFHLRSQFGENRYKCPTCQIYLVNDGRISILKSVNVSSDRHSEPQKITYTTKIIQEPHVCQIKLPKSLVSSQLQKGLTHDDGPKTPLSSSLRQRSQQLKTVTPHDFKTVIKNRDSRQHNLDERRSRSELNHLFTDLCSNIPSLKGCKASKITILSTAAKYIAQLKSEEQLLIQELNSEKRRMDVNIGLKIYLTNQIEQQNSSDNIH